MCRRERLAARIVDPFSMCGIAGILNLTSARPPSEDELGKMIGQLYHRGPDGYGFFHDAHVGLAHARLSIIDLAGGKQPIHNEDRTVWVSFNGEIFNYIELRAALEQQGHRFYTQSDTEVIVHLYEQHGEDFVQHLNGQFAIALWDQRARKLLLVRDRAGILPLFYEDLSGRLRFASEIKSLLVARDSSPAVNRRALRDVFTYWSPLPPETMFEGVFAVRPGEMLIVDGRGLRKRQYWNWSYPPDTDRFTGNETEAAEQVRALLDDAIRIRLRADVPVGAYLSGGLDSSILAALAVRQQNAQLSTFSIGFEQGDLDERGYQEMLTREIGVSARTIVCDAARIGREFPRTIWHTEMPVLRTAPAPMGILSGLVRESGFKVVLTGEGADEVFGGYDLFKEAKIRRFWAAQPQSKFRPLLLKRLYPYLDLTARQGQAYLEAFFGTGLGQAKEPFFGHLPRWEMTRRCQEFFVPDFHGDETDGGYKSAISRYPELSQRWTSFEQTQFLEARLLMPEYLLSSQGDRMLMMNSVEGRFPYLDHRVIEFANRLPPRMKMRVLDEKHILKMAAGDLVPDAIRRRPKQPYRAPDGLTFVGAGAPEYVRDLLAEEQLRRYGYFSPDKVTRLVRKFESGRAVGYKDNMSLVGVLSTQLWHYQFVERHGADH